MRVAIIHYWLVGMRGGEKVVEALCRMYPQADLYTHVVAPEKLSAELAARHIRTSFIQKLPGSVRHYQKYLPLMPLALEQLDLRQYDLVISSESGPAKGVITRADTAHVCYCHSPMRYLWDFQQDYLDDAGRFMRFFMRPLFHYLRMWDVLSAMRVDRIAANSRTVARRVARHWRRDATVVHPPVDCAALRAALEHGNPRASFMPEQVAASATGVSGAAATGGGGGSLPQPGYYLCLGQLVGYKRFDLAVQACTATGRRLVVVGDGEQRAALQQLAGPSVTFLGWCSAAEIAALYAGCRALLFPGEEDFGLVPVEAMALGRPVVAYGRGGATESVVDGTTGLFFDRQDVAALIDALERFEKDEAAFDAERIAHHAESFGEGRFRQEFAAVVDAALRDKL